MYIIKYNTHGNRIINVSVFRRGNILNNMVIIFENPDVKNNIS